MTCEAAPGTSPATTKETDSAPCFKTIFSPTRTFKAFKAAADKNNALASKKLVALSNELGIKEEETKAALKKSSPTSVNRSVRTTNAGLTVLIPKTARRLSQASICWSSMFPRGATNCAEA